MAEPGKEGLIRCFCGLNLWKPRVAPTPSGQKRFGVPCNTAACGLPGF